MSRIMEKKKKEQKTQTSCVLVFQPLMNIFKLLVTYIKTRTKSQNKGMSTK